MPKRLGKQRSFLEIFDDAAGAIENAAVEVLGSVTKRLEDELFKGASKLSETILESQEDQQFCQCTGNVYFDPDGFCHTCARRAANTRPANGRE